MVVCERQNELFIPVFFLAAQPAIEALKRVHIEAQMLSRLFTFSQAKNPVLLLFHSFAQPG